MTAQATESLIYQGEQLPLCEEPLAGFFRLIGNKPPFEAPHTALWRGYIGAWEIIEQRLYLTALRGWIDGSQQVDLSFLFPEYPERVFAHWVTGRLRATRGKRVRYVHAGFVSVYQQDVFFRFDDGILSSVEVQDNAPSEQANKPPGHRNKIDS